MRGGLFGLAGVNIDMEEDLNCEFNTRHPYSHRVVRHTAPPRFFSLPDFQSSNVVSQSATDANILHVVPRRHSVPRVLLEM